MSVFSNRLEDAGDEAQDYVAAILELLGDRDPVVVLGELSTSVEEILQDATEAQLREPEAPGKWCMLEVVHHLADSELVWAYRLRCVLADDDPKLTGYDQDRWAARLRYRDVPLAEVLHQLTAFRRVNLRLLSSLTPEELERTGLHTERGAESVAHMIRLYAGHDLVHLQQLQRMASKLGLA